MSSSDLKAPETSSQPIGIVAGPAHSFLCDDEHIRVKFVEQVARAGYATDPNYSEELAGIIRSYQLEQYDR